MMTFTRTATTVSAAVLALVWTSSGLSAQQSSLSDRVAAGVQAVEGACAADASKFCGNVPAARVGCGSACTRLTIN